MVLRTIASGQSVEVASSHHHSIQRTSSYGSLRSNDPRVSEKACAHTSKREEGQADEFEYIALFANPYRRPALRRRR
jgi:hypothetical protein